MTNSQGQTLVFLFCIQTIFNSFHAKGLYIGQFQVVALADFKYFILMSYQTIFNMLWIQQSYFIILQVIY